MKQTEIEQKKEYLKGYEKAVRQMERIELKIKQMRLNKLLPSVINDGMPHAKSQNDLSGYVALLDQEERYYQECKCKRIKQCKEITDRIEQLDNEDEKDVLMFRYIELIKWEDIAVKMKMSQRQVYRIHVRALKNFKMS